MSGNVTVLNIISTHTSLAGRDMIEYPWDMQKIISTHTSLAGRDTGECEAIIRDGHFYSHVPRGT